MNRLRYDVVVIGAGPAGALAARQCAASGASVLLLEKKTFPRDKACGCCISAAALDLLGRLGLPDLHHHAHAEELHEFHLAMGRRRAVLRLPHGAAVDRAVFDAWLVEQAVSAGCDFIDGCAARIGDVRDGWRCIPTAPRTILARTAIAATGLNGHCSAVAEAPVIAPHSHIGIAAVLDHDAPGYAHGIIHMTCHAAGYVGIVRLPDHRTNIAAALNPRFIRSRGGPLHAVSAVLDSCFMPPLDLAGAAWLGTPHLTRCTPTLAAERLLVIGDAAGYIEPFTGEGIAWALASGTAAAELAVQPWRDDLAAQWTQHMAALRRHQRVCRAIAAVLRRPTPTCMVIFALNVLPALARPILAAIHRPLPLDSRRTGA